MDNIDNSNPDNQDLDNPVPSDTDYDMPVPADSDDTDESGISHAPLDLGGSRAVEITKPEAPRQVVRKPATGSTGPTDRIIGVKTFFTKLHPGAVIFLDEQITEWLQKNPDIIIKRTNVVVGEIQAKKTEPNILITVWY